jgi:putative ABC transport system permease protein
MKRFGLWLLARSLRDREELDMVAGDLEEEARLHGSLWYLCQAIAIARHAVSRRQDPAPSTGDSLMQTLIMDARLAFRALSKRPSLTAVVALTLGLGLGANAAIFNMIDRLILRPYPFADPDRAVMLAETGNGLDFRKESVSPANFRDWRDRTTTIAHLSAIDWWDANLTDRGNPERVQGSQVSYGFFDALAVHPQAGRAFVKDDETFGRHHVAVISDELWARRFQRDPSVIGRRILVDGEPYEVIGIAPPRFSFPDGAMIWSPLAFDPKTPPSRHRRYLTVVGRLQPGKTLDEASNEMTLIATRLAQEYPDDDRDYGIATFTLAHGMMDVGLGPIMGLWQASAFIVLLIACANIANLQLARASERRRETGVRLALGASRGRILRELLTESFVLALVSIPFAVAFSWLFLYVMRAAMPSNIIRFVPGWESLGPDFRLLAFTVLLAIVTACIFGALPAVQAARSPVVETLKDGGRTSTGRHFARRAIVVIEMTIALPLLVAAGLGVLGTNRFLNGPQGYDPDGVLTMKLSLPTRAYPDNTAWRGFVKRAVDAIAAVPGVQQVSVINNAPGTGSNSSRVIEIDGHPASDPQHPPEVANLIVTPGYFETMQIPVGRGRAFTSVDRDGAAPVAIVSESMARKYWPGEDPIGRRLRVANGPWMTVVGISGDIIHDWFARRNVPTMYRPFDQVPVDYFSVVVRVQGDPGAIAAPVRQALLGIDPTQPVFDMMTMRRQLHERTIGLQYLAGVMGVFAGISLLLAAVGLYAVMAYMLAQRTQEIGIRMALGASRRDVLRLTVGDAVRLASIGAVLGAALSIALNRLMEAGLLGIASGSARVLLAFATVLMLTALAAAYFPARRAASLDPNTALRVQ